LINLYDYQQQAITNVRNAYKSGKNAPILVMPTGSGKTVTSTYIAMSAAAKGKRVLFLAHRRELVQQLSDALSEWDVEHGTIESNSKHTTHNVQVASAQTLVRRLPLDKSGRYKFDLVVIDECHHVTEGTTWGKILDHNTGAKYLGLTATPRRLDGKGLDTYFDDIVQVVTVLDLIERGKLARPVIYAPPKSQAINLSKIKKTAGDYNIAELAELVDTKVITGDAIKHYQRHADRQPSIAFAVTIEHAEHIAATFAESGYQTAALSGRTSAKERNQMIKDLGRGHLHVLSSCNVISEGTDIPIVAAAILLRPTASFSLSMQQIGRALRKYEGKEKAVILDHAGNTLRHGLPTDDHEWTLQSREKKKRKQDDESSVKQCDQCFAIMPRATKICSECGYVFEVSERNEIDYVDEDLVEIDAVKVARERKKEQARCKNIQDLIMLGKQRGYKNPSGWARHIMTARYAR